mgnify:CR=1 FL=1
MDLLTGFQPRPNAYLRFDELRALFQDFGARPGFSVRTVGQSECERPIELLSFGERKGSGTGDILIYGGEDATEPIFSLTMKWLIEELADSDSPIHKRDYRWHFLSCINPDGYVKNESWFSEPGKLESFLDHGWEDLHRRMIHFCQEERPELKALREAISLVEPDVIFNAHDESHFPADGYKYATSEAVPREHLQGHLSRVEAFMDLSEEELVLTEDYGRDPVFSVAPAFEQGRVPLVFLNETCGYRRKEGAVDCVHLDKSDDLYGHLERYLKLLEEHERSELCSALFHVRLLLQSFDGEAGFNSKMLAITGHGLRVLLADGVEEAREIRRAFWQHIEENFARTWEPVPLWQQVVTQLDFLFTMLDWRGA